MCVVTVDRVIASEINGTTVEKVTVFGTVLDCPPVPPTPPSPDRSRVQIFVALLVNGQPDPTVQMVSSKEIPIVPAGFQQNWSQTLKDFRIPCGSSLRVRAECETDPACFFEQDFIVSCDCPQASLTTQSISRTCNPDGTLTVTFSLELTNLPGVDPVFGTLHLGNGVSGSAVLPVQLDPTAPGPEWSAQGGGFVGEFSFDYQPGTYDSVSFEMTFPGACAVTVPLANGPLDVGSCVATNCPADADVVFVVSNAAGNPVGVGPNDPCLPAGDYVVTATAPDPTGRDYTWSVDNPPPIDPNANGRNRNSFRRTLAAGTTTEVSLSIATSGCATPATGSVTLRACESSGPDPSDCPDDEDIVFRVTDSSGNAVPVGPIDPCLPAGDYVVTATAPDPNGRDYTWSADSPPPIDPSVNGRGRNSCPRTIDAATTSQISVTIATRGCRESARGTVTLRACDRTEPPPPPPPPPDWCLIWFWINIFLMLGTGVFIVITFCMMGATVWSAIAALASGGTLAAVTAALTTTNIVMLWISFFLVVITLGSYILWLIFCAPGRTDVCSLMGILMGILSTAGILSGIIAAILWAIGMFLCALGGFIDVAWFAILAGICWWVGYGLGCRLENPNAGN